MERGGSNPPGRTNDLIHSRRWEITRVLLTFKTFNKNMQNSFLNFKGTTTQAKELASIIWDNYELLTDERNIARIVYSYCRDRKDEKFIDDDERKNLSWHWGVLFEIPKEWERMFERLPDKKYRLKLYDFRYRTDCNHPHYVKDITQNEISLLTSKLGISEYTLDSAEQRAKFLKSLLNMTFEIEEIIQ